MEFAAARPGSAGEHEIQERYGTTPRADRFYQQQMLDHLNDRMQVFVGRQEMIFIATSDADGDCDCSFRAGPPGFVRVLDERTITWPEYRGNGVMASMGNISENAHVGVLMMDFFKDVVGLHVNGGAGVVEDDEMQARYPWLMEEAPDGKRPDRWVVVAVHEAYIHCSKHIPRMMRVRSRRSANETRKDGQKGADYFNARTSPRPWGDGASCDAELPPAGPPTEPPAEPPAEQPAAEEYVDTRDQFARVREDLGHF